MDTYTKATLIVDDIAVDEASNPEEAGRLAFAARLTLHRFEDYGAPRAWYVEYHEYERGTDRPVGERPFSRGEVLDGWYGAQAGRVNTTVR